MSSPNFIIKCSDRPQSGTLLTSAMQQIKHTLLNRGFVLLPSDTCYSVAMLAIQRDVRNSINTLLNRPSDQPISLAFPNLAKIEKFVYLNNISASLLEKFTPGPITVVCNVREELPVELTSVVAGSNNRTMGVRIPDSFIERDIASCTEFPITTVAVRNPLDNNKPVKDFEQAIEIVKKGMENEKLRNHLIWGAAVEGERFYANQSTVVYVTGDAEKLKLEREGDISFKEIQSALGSTSFWAIEEWT